MNQEPRKEKHRQTSIL